MRIAWLVIGAAGCLMLCAPQVHAVKLKYTAQVGEEWQRKVTAKGDGEVGGDLRIALNFDVASLVSSKVTAIDPDDTIVSTVAYKMETLTAAANGMTVLDKPFPTDDPLEISMTSQGKIVKIQSAKKDAQNSAREGNNKKLNIDPVSLLCIGLPQFPETELQVGDTWDATPNPELLPMKMTGKLLAVKKVEDKDVAEIECTFVVSADAFVGFLTRFGGVGDFEVSGPGATGTFTTLVDVATGFAESGRGEAKFEMSAKNPYMDVPINVKMDFTIAPVEK